MNRHDKPDLNSVLLSGKIAEAGKYGYAVIVSLVVLLNLLIPALSSAKIYIDITSPSIKKMPVAVFDLQGPQGA